MEALIQADNLCVQFGDNRVLQDVSLSLARQEILVVLGRSGCGKSTLLRHLIGLRRPDRGVVRLFGEDLYALSGDDEARALRRIGVLFQSGALFNSLSLEQNVAMPLIEHLGRAPEVARAEARIKLALVGLEKAARMLPAEVSGGMKKRAGLARALALDPELLLLDEPSAGLDPVSARRLDDLVLGLKRDLNVGFMVVTHDLGSIGTIADRAIMLDQGRILAQGTVAELRALSNPVVSGFFARRADTADDMREAVTGLVKFSRPGA